MLHETMIDRSSDGAERIGRIIRAKVGIAQAIFRVFNEKL